MKDTLTAAQRVALARSPSRPNAQAYVDALFTGFFELHGDRAYGDDGSILGGLAFFEGRPVTVLAQRKGRALSENLSWNFGMPQPEGYRKARRLMEEAQRFGRPVITFVDTPGAYPGIGAEERGQGEAIARCIAAMMSLTVPVVSVFIGEGGSGGALALGAANAVIMLENAVYSVLSPEGFASILWKDPGRSAEAAQVMGLTARDLLRLGVADRIVPEPEGGATPASAQVFLAVRKALSAELDRLCRLGGKALAQERYEKFRRMGAALRQKGSHE